jgi:mono/diheme cytochrome c family protein
MRLSPHTTFASIAFLMIAAAAPVRGQSSPDHPGQYSALDIETGSRLYAGQCALCHSPTGDGVAGVDLRRGQFRRASSDDDLAGVITTGVASAGMPGFKLQPSEVDGLIAFIRAGFDVTGTAVKVGRADRGKTVFESKGAARRATV